MRVMDRELPASGIRIFIKATFTLGVLLFCNTSFAESVGCNDSFVQLNVNTLTIEVDATGLDDTDNIQCALDAATDDGISTVKLGLDTFSISSLLVEGFKGSFEGNTVTTTTLVATDGSIDCSAMQSAGRTSAVIKFTNGEPRVRFMTIQAHRPCEGNASVESILHFTGDAADGFHCGNDVIFGAVDRVLLDGTSPADGPEVAIAVHAESDILGGCDQKLLGTFKLNRSTVMNATVGVVTQLKAGAQVDINFNTFEQNSIDVLIPNASQSTTITGNSFSGVADQLDYLGVWVRTDEADAPASNRVVIHKNTFMVEGLNQDVDGIAIAFEQTAKIANLSTVTSENTFNLSGTAAGVVSGGVSGSVVNGNRFSGSAIGGIFANTSGFAVAKNWSIMGNTGFRNLASQGPDITLGTDLSNSVVGANQTEKVLDLGTDNSVLPLGTDPDVLDRLDNIEHTIDNLDTGVSAVTASHPLMSSGGSTPNISLSGSIPVGAGGIGRSTLDPNGILIGNGTDAVTTAVGTTGEVLVGNTGSTPTWTGSPSLSGDLSIDGRLGVGTTAPDANIEVVSTSTAEILATAHGSVGLFIGQTAGGSPGAETAVSNGSELAWFGGRGHTGNAWSGSRGAMIVNASEDWTDSNNGAEIAFGTTANGTSSRVERMRISHNGNVGIGTSTPDINAQLEVEGTSTTSIMVTAHNSLARIIGRTAGGSPDARTASTVGSSLAWFSGQGFTGSEFSATRAVMDMQASENWTDSRHGTDIAFGTTANGSTSRQERMRILNNGNVGIGTSTPTADLEVVNVSTAAIKATAHGSVGQFIGQSAGGSPGSETAVGSGTQLAWFAGRGFTGSGYSGSRGTMIVNASENWTNSRNGAEIAFGTTPNGSTSRQERLRITNAGNVGIGTATPDGQLEIVGPGTASVIVTAHNSLARFIGRTAGGTPNSESASTAGSSLAWFSAQGHTGSGFSPTRAVMDMQASENWSTTRHGTNIIFGTTANGTTSRQERMRISQNGSVGIGTTNPGSKASLEVATFAGSQNVSNFGFYGDTTFGIFPAPFLADDVSIHAAGRILSGSFIAFSDQRIKKIDGRSDSANDLLTLMSLEVTDYQYIDRVAKGAGQQKKLIAQQVETVYPQAVSRGTDVVPDIYTMASIQGGWVELDTNLKVGERVRLIGENIEGIHEVLEIAAGRFRTAFEGQGDKVFVYGREVDDFRMVDYEAIAMLNVSATQQLHRRLEKMNANYVAQAELLTQQSARIAALTKDRQEQLALTDVLIEQNSEIAVLKKQMAELLAAGNNQKRQLESASLAAAR